MKTIYKPDTASWHMDYSDDLTPTQKVYDQVSHAIANDRDNKVKQALIDLGWRPPAKCTRPGNCTSVTSDDFDYSICLCGARTKRAKQ